MNTGSGRFLGTNSVVFFTTGGSGMIYTSACPSRLGGDRAMNPVFLVQMIAIFTHE